MVFKAKGPALGGNAAQKMVRAAAGRAGKTGAVGKPPNGATVMAAAIKPVVEGWNAFKAKVNNVENLDPILQHPMEMSAYGEVTSVDRAAGTYVLRMRGGKDVTVKPSEGTWYKVMENMDGVRLDRVPESSLPATSGAQAGLNKYIQEGRVLSAAGTYYPEQGHLVPSETKLMHTDPKKFGFEEARWWSTQLTTMSDDWINTLFKGKTDITASDFEKNYQTYINQSGQRLPERVQETAQLSRLLYTFTASYMATGDVKYLKVAKAGTEFQRQWLRSLGNDGETALWLFGRRQQKVGEAEPAKPLMASENGDDKGAIPLYEQIYAITGLAMYYRATLDAQALNDIRLTLNTFQKHFHDAKNGGYFSHVEPNTLKPDEASLGDNRSRKNWNSIGDHIPAYLVNLMTALGPKTSNPKDPLNPLRTIADNMLRETTDLIVKKFPDKGSPFVQERFHEDWTPDKNWRWQQDRAVIGHNFKIGWNLTRAAFHFQTEAKVAQGSGDTQAVKDNTRRATEALALSKKLARTMSDLGIDPRSGGVYDTAERRVDPKTKHVSLTWGPHKDFWQQEQGILDLQIATGAFPEEKQFLADARNLQAFWSNFATEKGIAFRTNQAGLQDTRYNFGNMGDHATLYHGAENAFLARWYNALYVTKEPIAVHYQLTANRAPGLGGKEVVSLAPDFVAPGQVEIDFVDMTANGVTTRVPRAAIDQQRLSVALGPKERGQEVSLTVGFKPLGKPLTGG